MALANYIIRAFQILFGAVALGLSATAVQWQKYGSAPATSSYSIFAGGFAIVAGFIGIAAGRFDAIPQLIMAIIDGLTSLLLLAGGIAFAIGMRGVSCSDPNTQQYSHFLTGGCTKNQGSPLCGYGDDGNAYKRVEKRCKLVYTDDAFLFLGFAVSLGAAVLCFLASKRTGPSVKRPSTV